MIIEKVLAEGSDPEDVLYINLFDGRLEEARRVLFHQDYFRTMIFRDVADRHDALHPLAVRDLAYRLLNSAASLHSVNALTGYLKSISHRVSRTFVGDVLSWLEDAYALFTVRLFGPSLSRQNVNLKKICAVDHALVHSTSTGILVNNGHLLENLVYLDRRRRGCEVLTTAPVSGLRVAWKETGASPWPRSPSRPLKEATRRGGNWRGCVKHRGSSQGVARS